MYRNIGLVPLMAAVMFVSAGCQQPGMNKKMALADSAGVLGTGVALDEAQDFNVAKGKVIEVAEALKAFCQSGSLGDLPLADVRDLLEKFMRDKGWGAYTYMVDAALTYVKTVDVDTEKIGANNLKLIETALDGVIRQAKRSRAEWATGLK